MSKTTLKMAMFLSLAWALWRAAAAPVHAQGDSSNYRADIATRSHASTQVQPGMLGVAGASQTGYGQVAKAEKALPEAAPGSAPWAGRTVAGGFAILLGLQCVGRVIPRVRNRIAATGSRDGIR